MYKVLTFKDSRHGRSTMEATINSYANSGWRLVDTDSKTGRRTLTRTVVKGVVFLPWGVTGGKKKGEITVTMERDE